MATYNVLIKVGDQHDRLKGWKNGMVVSARPSTDKLWGGRIRRSCAIIQIPDITKEEIDQFLAIDSKYSEREALQYMSGSFIDMDRLRTEAGASYFDSMVLNKAADSPLLILPYINKTILKPTDQYDFERPYMHGTETIGTFTVGDTGSGTDYDNLYLASADHGDLTGDLTYDVQISHTTTGDEGKRAVWTANLNGHTLLVHSSANYRHSGNLSTAPVVIDVNLNNANECIYLATEHEGTIEVAWLTMTTSDKYNPSYRMIYCAGVDNGTDQIQKVHHNLMRGLSGGNTPYGIETNDSSIDTIHIYGNVIWDFVDDGIMISTDANVSTIVENNTVYNCTAGINCNSQAAVTCRNNACFANGTDFLNIGSSTGENNASDDATAADGNWSTGSGNKSSLDPATEFQSVDDTEATFMHIVSAGGNLAGQGAAVSVIASDIDGGAMNSPPDIGADQLPVAAGGASRRRVGIGGGGWAIRR